MTGVLARIARAWRALSSEQRLAAIAALLLFVSMLFPWYDQTIVTSKGIEHRSMSAFGVYSFIEAAIFVVAIGVLVLMWARAERKTFHLPGGDGTVVMAAGLWVMFLIFYRQLDKPGEHKEGAVQTSTGVAWGIFIAFLLGALLAYAGYRIRAAHVPEPVEEDAPTDAAPTDVAPREKPPPATDDTTIVARPRKTTDGAPFEGQLSFDEPAEYRPPPRRRTP